MVEVRDVRARRHAVAHAAGALLLVACAQVLVVEGVVAAAWRAGRPYDRADDHVSDLGMPQCGEVGGRAVCSPLHDAMNASFVLQGVLVVAAAVLLRDLLPRRWRAAVATAAAVHAVGVALVGLVPRSLTAPAGAAVHVAHDVGAVLAVVGGNAAVLLTGLAVRRVAGAYAVVSVVLAAVGAGAVLLELSGAVRGPGAGAVQRATMYGVPVWLALTGAALLAALPAAGSARSRVRAGGMGA